LRESLTYPGTWRLLKQQWPIALREEWQDKVTNAFLRECRKYVPELEAVDLEGASAESEHRQLEEMGSDRRLQALEATGAGSRRERANPLLPPPLLLSARSSRSRY
jgi:hypothetical protein